MYEVALACSVRRRVIRPENLEGRTTPRSRVNGQWNQMGFGSHVAQSGKVDHRLRLVKLERLVERRGVENVAPSERTPADEVGAPPRQVIERDGRHRLRGQGFTRVAANETRPAGTRIGAAIYDPPLHGGINWCATAFLTSTALLL